MAGIRRVSDLGTKGWSNILDGSIVTADLANSTVTTSKIADNNITQAKLDTAIPLSGMRNTVINGNFDIWQRGTPISTDAAATQIYTADRWAARALYPGNSSIQTITRESSTSHVPSGSRYSLKSVIGTSAVLNNARMQLSYALETADSLKFAGKQMTLSFKVKAIQNIDRIAIELRYSTTEGRIFDSTLISSTTFTINNSSFTTCSYTFTVPSAATLTSTGNFGFVLTYTRAAGTEQIGDGVYLAQVQLEEGTQLTPFEQRPIGVELALCQRYFQIFGTASVEQVFGSSYFNSAVYIALMIGKLVGEMRTSPSLAVVTGGSIYNVNTGVTTNSITWNVGSTSSQTFYLYSSNAIGTANGQSLFIYAQKFNISAEL